MRILVLYDAVGSLGTKQEFLDGLAGAGIGLCVFNPINPLVLQSGTFPFFQINSTGTCGGCNPSFTFSLNGAYKAYVGTAAPGSIGALASCARLA